MKYYSLFFVFLASCTNAGDVIPIQESNHTKSSNKYTKNMSQSQLLELMKTNLNGYVLVDVRSPEEYAEGHIKGSINIPHHMILQNISLLDNFKHENIIIYCRSGRRAKSVTDLLEQQVYLQDIYHLEGDILGWKKSGLGLAK